MLRGVGERNEPFPVPHTRGDEARHGRRPPPASRCQQGISAKAVATCGSSDSTSAPVRPSVRRRPALRPC
jgi:hypothetical protein